MLRILKKKKKRNIEKFVEYQFLRKKIAIGTNKIYLIT